MLFLLLSIFSPVVSEARGRVTSFPGPVPELDIRGRVGSGLGPLGGVQPGILKGRGGVRSDSGPLVPTLMLGFVVSRDEVVTATKYPFSDTESPVESPPEDLNDSEAILFTSEETGCRGVTLA